MNCTGVVGVSGDAVLIRAGGYVCACRSRSAVLDVVGAWCVGCFGTWFVMWSLLVDAGQVVLSCLMSPHPIKGGRRKLRSTEEA